MKEKKVAAAVGSSVGAEEQHPPKAIIKNTIPYTDEFIKQVIEENDRIAEEEIAEQKKKGHSLEYLETCSGAELLGQFFGNLPYIIDGLLDPGVYLLVGAPKLGKSFLALQIACHVSTGKSLWGYKVRKGTVLYMALEDTDKRLQRRFYKMTCGEKSEQDEDYSKLILTTKARSVKNGLIGQLAAFMKDHPDTSLIIIDTLQKVRDDETEVYSYANDYALIAKFMELVKTFGIAVILVHHTRKQWDGDPYNMVSGTNGLTGAVDGTIIMTKEKRTDDCAVLEITGRDLQDQKLHLKRNLITLGWDLESRETELWKEPEDPVLEKVSEFIRDKTRWVGTATQLCEELNLDMKANALSFKLNANVSRLYKDYGIQYLNKRTNKCRYLILNADNGIEA